MGLNDLQTHIFQGIPEAIKPVDLFRMADGRKGPFKLVVDGECCLDRLYGGYFPDWVCGGQWNKMEQFLANFGIAIRQSPVELVVFLNGCLEPEKLMSDWCKNQEETYKHLQEIQKHVTMKKKPPPKVWWMPPAFLRSALRLAFRNFNMKVMCSMDDHHKDLLRYSRKSNFDGILADDAEYLLFDTPRYFSAKKLKLTFRGSLDTVEVKLEKVYEDLNLPKERFRIFAAIIGNHILTEEDLASFYTALGVQNLQSKTSVIEQVAEFVRTLETLESGKVSDLIVSKAKLSDDAESLLLRNKVLKCLKYYGAIGQPSKLRASGPRQVPGRGAKKAVKSKAEDGKVAPKSIVATTSAASILPSDNDNLDIATTLGDESDNAGNAVDPLAGCSSVPLSNGIPDVLTRDNDNAKERSSVEQLVYRVSHSIENIAMNRHKSGIMSPYICQILKNRAVKLPIVIEDIKNLAELPKAHELFRPLRQRVYAILYNLHHIHFVAKQNSEKEPIIFIEESLYDPVTKCVKTIGVPAVQIGWAVPTVEKLWLGEGEEAKRKRIRAFLTCLKSEKQAMLDSSIVPQQLLVLCCVLRYIISFEKKVLTKNELDAFITQALILELTDPDVAQDIEVRSLTMRGVHLSHLFMEGVEMALLVNDACGAPIPFIHFSPWYFFNGKIFNFVMEQLALGKGLPEICGFKMNLVFKVNQLRMAVLDGVKLPFAPPALNSILANNGPLMPVMFGNGRFQSSFQNPFDEARMNAVAELGGYRGAQYGRDNNLHNYAGSPAQNSSNFGGLQLPTFGALNNTGLGRQRRSQRGGQLEIAGTVVGSWGPNAGYGGSTYLGTHGFVRRNPLVPTPVAQSNSNQLTSLMGQMRISPRNKPNSRGGAHSGNQWSQIKPRNQSKTFVKKNKSTNSANGASNRGETEPTTDTSSGSTNKPKGVSFSDEASIGRVLGNEDDGSEEALVYREQLLCGERTLVQRTTRSTTAGEGAESSQTN